MSASPAIENYPAPSARVAGELVRRADPCNREDAHATATEDAATSHVRFERARAIAASGAGGVVLDDVVPPIIDRFADGS